MKDPDEIAILALDRMQSNFNEKLGWDSDMIEAFTKLYSEINRATRGKSFEERLESLETAVLHIKGRLDSPSRTIRPRPPVGR